MFVVVAYIQIYIFAASCNVREFYAGHEHLVTLAEWLRRVPVKYIGFPCESLNLSGDVDFMLN